MVLSLSVSNLFFCMTASDSHRFAHWDAPYKIDILQYDELETPTNRSVYHILDALYKIEILQYELETLNQLVPIGLAITSR